MTTKSKCFEQPQVTRDEVLAIKALSKGEANEHQQVLALALIVKKIARTYDVHFIPGAADETAFLQGRSFVGQRVLKYVNTPINELKDLPDETQ